ncbi:MAG: Fe-S cluster assembly sulfur transfer protein SufU [Bacteroidota bacterium]
MKKANNGLYHELILQHNKRPLHYRKWPEAPVQLMAYNRLCGDQFKLYLSVEKGEIREASFHGYGCAISKAATSILVDLLIGKSLKEADKICAAYLEIVEGKNLAKETKYPAFEAFAAARDYPSRKKCASLSGEVLQQFLQETINTDSSPE